jgi:selenocysteine lyase/cysteine desulfurase
VDELRAEFPVLERVAYMNAGSNGPVPRRGVEAAREALELQLEQGRGGHAFFEAALGAAERLRSRVAAILACPESQLALTANTTDGVNTALAALQLGPGDEVLTSDEEHPGVLGPLNVARRSRGVEVRVAPFAELADAVQPDTKVVVCSHVSWVNGQVVDTAALAASGARVVLDGAQGLGAVPIAVEELGCDFYACTGQKWLCGPNGVGYLHVRDGLAAELPPGRPGYLSVAEPGDALNSELHPDARRFDSVSPAPEHFAWALGALDVLEAPGLAAVQERAAELAAGLADRLAERGSSVAPRGRTTLVSWEDPDPPATAERLRDEGLVIRHLPGTPYVRASIGAWNNDQDIERLLAATD